MFLWIYQQQKSSELYQLQECARTALKKWSYQSFAGLFRFIPLKMTEISGIDDASPFDPFTVGHLAGFKDTCMHRRRKAPVAAPIWTWFVRK
jgi:hypothetical protein